MNFKIGDIVKYKAQFLHDVGWFTNVPKDGKVVALKTALRSCILVQWCDSDEPEFVNVHNLVLASTVEPSV